MEPSVTWRHYIDEVNVSPERYTDEELKRRGVILHYTTKLEGYNGKEVSLRWSVYDSKTKLSPAPSLRNQLALALTPRACYETAGEPIFVQTDALEGTFFARVFLYDHTGIVRDSKVTGSFTVRPSGSG